MSALFKIGSHVLINRMINSDFSGVGKAKVGDRGDLFSGFMLFVASGFFLYACYIWSNANFSLDIAAAITGGLALGLALINMLVRYVIYRIKVSKLKKIKDELLHIIENAMKTFDEEFSEPIKDNPKTAAAMATIVGYAAANRF